MKGFIIAGLLVAAPVYAFLHHYGSGFVQQAHFGMSRAQFENRFSSAR